MTTLDPQQFLKNAQRVSLRTGESNSIKENIMKKMQEPSVRMEGSVRLHSGMSTEPMQTLSLLGSAGLVNLTAEEKDDIRIQLREFMKANPQQSAGSTPVNIWQGVNMFRHIRPFFLSDMQVA